MKKKIGTLHGYIDVPCDRIYYITLNGQYWFGTDTPNSFAIVTELLGNALKLVGKKYTWRTFPHRDADGEVLYITREFNTK